MADDLLNILNCAVEDVIQPRPPDEALAAFYSIAQGLLPGLNLPFNTDYALRNSAATSSPNYDIKLPAGVTIPMLDKPEAIDMVGWLQPIMAVINQAMMVLGPIKILIDIIIAIINVFCSFPDPFKIAEAISKLMLALLPLLGLFPVTAGMLVLLETVKAIIMILVAVLTQILPKIELILENVQMITAYLQGNNPGAAEGAVAKICSVAQSMIDGLAMLAPVNKILAIINTFLGLLSNGICAPGSAGTGGECCDDCPEIVRNPPIGLSNLVDSTTSNFRMKLNTARYGNNYLGAPSVGNAVVGESISVARSIDSVGFQFTNRSLPTSSEPLGSFLTDLSWYKPDMFTALLRYSVDGIVNTPIATVTRNNNYVNFVSVNDQPFVTGDKIRVSGTGAAANLVAGDHTVIATNTRAITISLPGDSFAAMNGGSLVIRKHFKMSNVQLDDNDVILTLDGKLPEDAAVTSYELVPDESRIAGSELMTMGCMSNVAISRGTFERTRDADLVAAVTTNNGGIFPPNTRFDSSPNILLGTEIPTIDEDGIKQAIIDFANNPGDAGKDLIFNKINNEINRFTDIASRALCLLVSSLNSILSVDFPIVDFSANIVATISYQPRSKDNQPLLIGIPSNIDINAVFTTNLGTLGDTTFDINTGTYSATLTSTVPGVATVKAFFVTSDVCSTPQDADFNQKSINIQFIDGTQRARRAGRAYVQSAGGRRR